MYALLEWISPSLKHLQAIDPSFVCNYPKPFSNKILETLSRLTIRKAILNSYTKFIILEITSRFACGESNLY